MQVVKYNGVSITLKSGTVRTKLQQSYLNRHFPITLDMSDIDWISISQYTGFLARAEFEGDLGFFVPVNGATDAEYMRGLEAFLDTPQDFYDTVIVTLLTMDSPVNEVELTPEVEKKA